MDYTPQTETIKQAFDELAYFIVAKQGINIDKHNINAFISTLEVLQEYAPTGNNDIDQYIKKAVALLETCTNYKYKNDFQKNFFTIGTYLENALTILVE